MDRPNIIFYFSDQQRADTFKADITPTLWAMGEEGAVFNSAYTCQPVCGPARACLQTGVYASENGCYRNDIAMDKSAVTIAKLFNENGYDTAYIGKWHLASEGLTQNYQTKAVPEELRGGYRYWRAADCLEWTSNGAGGYIYGNDGEKLEFNYCRANAINDYALEYIRNRDKSKPYFMFVSQLEPHHQNTTDLYECPEGAEKEFENHPIPEDLAALNGNYESRYASYLACCNTLDKNVARLIETLKEDGSLDNTVIIYTSDHGCHFRTRNFEYKRSCHDASIHVPMVAIGGAFNSHGIYDGLVSLIDIPATLLDIAGITPPEHFRGNSLISYLNGEIQRDNVYVEISESQLGRAIRTDKYTYSVRKRKSLGLTASDSDKYIEDKLFDNEKDPHQLNNLIRSSKYSGIRAELRATLLDEIYKVSGKRPKIKPKLTSFNLNEPRKRK